MRSSLDILINQQNHFIHSNKKGGADNEEEASNHQNSNKLQVHNNRYELQPRNCQYATRNPQNFIEINKYYSWSKEDLIQELMLVKSVSKIRSNVNLKK